MLLLKAIETFNLTHNANQEIRYTPVGNLAPFNSKSVCKS